MKSRESELIFLYLFFDLILLNLSIFLIGLNTSLFTGLGTHDVRLYYFHGNLSWVITYFILTKKNLYLRDGYLNRFRNITNRIFNFTVVALIIAYFFMNRATYSRVFLFEYTALFYAFKVVFYYFLYLYLKNQREKGIHVNRAIIVGWNETGQLLHKLIDFNPMLGYKFLGFVDDNNPVDTDILGKTDELERIIKEHHVEMVFVTISIFNESTKTKEFLRLCSKTGTRLRFVPDNQHWFKNRTNMDSIGELVLINPQEIPLDDYESYLMKRLFDIVFSLFVIVFIMSWLLPIVAILIKLNSRGPVFFIQKRTGINNRSFNCLKFRSMKVNNEADVKQATDGDDRITTLGNFLRKSNIDELPQFFNVLVGQMSVVGPRPHMLKHTDQYSKLIESYLVRHYIKPGITGYAQVTGYRGETDELWKMEKRVEYDMIYLEKWNFWWDIKIIGLTFIDVIPSRSLKRKISK